MENFININIDGHNITFHNRSESTRHGFRHVSSMAVDGRHVGTGKVNYLNRTWEVYQFQTSMIHTVSNQAAQRMENLKEEYKRENGIQRMTAARRGEFEKIASQDEMMKLYHQTIDNLKHKVHF